MNLNSLLPTLAAIMCGLFTPAHCAFAQGSAFTYQGQLAENGTPANGVFDFQFRLYTAANTSGLPPLGVLSMEDTGVTNGLFTVALDYGAGNAFNGSSRWLEISVRPGGSVGAYNILAPLQPVTAAPYAIRALNVGTNGLVAGTYANAVTLNNPANSFTGNGAGLANVAATSLGGLGAANFWQTGGNAGTTAGANFLGTTDNQPLELKVNGARALRLEPTAGAPNVIGGASGNQITAPTAGGGVLSGASHRIYNGSDYSVIAGGQANDIGTNSAFSAIGGGNNNNVSDASQYATIAGGYLNDIGSRSYASAIGGGYDNDIAADSEYATIAAGFGNDIGTNSAYSAIGGGENHAIGANADRATIAGGSLNVIAPGAHHATVAGGHLNIVGTNAIYSSISGGRSNTIAAFARDATIVGGRGNEASGSGATVMGVDNTASDDFSTAMGVATTASGFASTALGNSVTASGDNSTALGSSTAAGGNSSTAMGYYTTASGGASLAMGSFAIASGEEASTALGYFTTASATASTALGAGTTASGYASTATGDSTTASGSRSTAMGRRAKALHEGSFVWADFTDADFASTSTNQFNIRASGGVRLSGDTPNLSFGSTTRQMINLWGTDYGIGVQSFGHYFRTDAGSGNFYWYRGGVHNNSMGNAGGGTTLMALTGGGLTVNGAFIGASDRNLKENFQPVNPRAVLDKVAALPLSEWNYKNDTASRHVGPMAQDFYAAFGVGPDDKHIATVDADGVALAAIQGLNQKVEAKESRIAELERQNHALLQRLEALEARWNIK